MYVNDLIDIFVDDSQHVRLYDLASDEVIFDGELCDIPYELSECEICSIDSLYKTNNFDGYITINIDTEDN